MRKNVGDWKDQGKACVLCVCSLCYWPTSTILQNPHSPLNSWEVVYGAALGRLLGIPRDLICSVQDSPCPWFGRTWGLPRTLLDAGCVWWLVASKLYGIHGTSTYLYGKQDQRWPSEDELLNELSPTIKINKESHIYGWGASLRGILLGWFLSMDPSGWFLAQERAWQPALALLSSMVCAALCSNLITCSASVGVWGWHGVSFRFFFLRITGTNIAQHALHHASPIEWILWCQNMLKYMFNLFSLSARWFFLDWTAKGHNFSHGVYGVSHILGAEVGACAKGLKWFLACGILTQMRTLLRVRPNTIAFDSEARGNSWKFSFWELRHGLRHWMEHLRFGLCHICQTKYCRCECICSMHVTCGFLGWL